MKKLILLFITFLLSLSTANALLCGHGATIDGTNFDCCDDDDICVDVVLEIPNYCSNWGCADPDCGQPNCLGKCIATTKTPDYATQKTGYYCYCSAYCWECNSGYEWYLNKCIPKCTPEICDGIDNDCDGKIDEYLTRSCYSGPSGTGGIGACKPGIQTCSAGSWGSCSGEITPTPEICDDGIDNDCDGEKDWDTLGIRGPEHGDDNCAVGVTAISVSNSNPYENTNIEVSCTSTVPNINSVQVFINTIECAWNDATDTWSGNTAIFKNCNVDSAGTKTVKCKINTAKSYAIIGQEEKTQQINVKSSTCSQYSYLNCPTDICNQCKKCDLKKWNGLAQDSCVEKNSCPVYSCNLYQVGETGNTCGAECDTSIGGCIAYMLSDICYYDSSCSTDCTCGSYSSENCPVAGTIVNSICYYDPNGNPRTCNDGVGCSLSTCTLTSGQTCDAIKGCVTPPPDCTSYIDQLSCVGAGCKWSGLTYKCDNNCYTGWTDTDGDGICVPPCSISSIAWKDIDGNTITNINKNEIAYSLVTGTNCNTGTILNYQILEKDIFLGSDPLAPDDTIVDSTFTFQTDNIASIEWLTTRQNDGYNPDNSYYVKIQTIESSLLQVLETPLIPQSILLSPETITKNIGETVQYSVTLTYSDSTTKIVTSQSTFSSSNELVATINNNGLATTIALGTTTITSFYEDLQDTAQLTVSTIPPPIECTSGECDTTNNKWCNNGYWDAENYCNNCPSDTDCIIGECTSDSDCLHLNTNCQFTTCNGNIPTTGTKNIGYCSNNICKTKTESCTALSCSPKCCLNGNCENQGSLANVDTDQATEVCDNGVWVEGECTDSTDCYNLKDSSGYLLYNPGECGKLTCKINKCVLEKDLNWETKCNNYKPFDTDCIAPLNCLLGLTGYKCVFYGDSNLCADSQYLATSGATNIYDIGCDSNFKCTINFCDFESACCYCYSGCVAKFNENNPNVAPFSIEECIQNGLWEIPECR